MSGAVVPGCSEVTVKQRSTNAQKRHEALTPTASHCLTRCLCLHTFKMQGSAPLMTYTSNMP